VAAWPRKLLLEWCMIHNIVVSTLWTLTTPGAWDAGISTHAMQIGDGCQCVCQSQGNRRVMWQLCKLLHHVC
jgi:hypothetical protein